MAVIYQRPHPRLRLARLNQHPPPPLGCVHLQVPCRCTHPSAHKSVLEWANPAWTQSVHLDAPGQRHGQQPVSGIADPGVVKQDKSSRGSVDTTKTRSDPQRVRMSSGEKPIGAAKGKQSDTEALCQTPPGTLCTVGSAANRRQLPANCRRLVASAGAPTPGGIVLISHSSVPSTQFDAIAGPEQAVVPCVKAYRAILGKDPTEFAGIILPMLMHLLSTGPEDIDMCITETTRYLTDPMCRAVPCRAVPCRAVPCRWQSAGIPPAAALRRCCRRCRRLHRPSGLMPRGFGQNMCNEGGVAIKAEYVCRFALRGLPIWGGGVHRLVNRSKYEGKAKEGGCMAAREWAQHSAGEVGKKSGGGGGGGGG